MNKYTAAGASHEDIDAEESAVHAWRVGRLARLGLAELVAEAVADHVDWHDVAALVDKGCPAALAVAILQ
jgi:hypothetical protein